MTKMPNIFKKNTSCARFSWSRVAFFYVLTLFFSANSLANSSQLLNKNRQDLAQIEKYLQNLTTISADFTQRSENGQASGKFYLSRPGKLRIEYKNSPKVLIVVSGATLTYKDLELDEVSEIATNKTPASFLTRQNISFDAKDVEIMNFIKDENFMRISVLKKNNKEAGEFSLIFKRNPLEFFKMEIRNDLGEVTEITLRNIEFGAKLENGLFAVK